MNLSEAKEILNTCAKEELRDHAFGDAEVVWLKDGKEVAGGYFGSGSAEVWFSTEDGHTTDTFKFDDARELRKCSAVVVVFRNDETGPDTYAEGTVMPGLTIEGVLTELTTPPQRRS